MARSSLAARPVVGVLLALVLAFLASGAPAAFGGTVLEVDRTDDEPTAAACTAAANDCSLRGAISNSNFDGAENVIELGANQTYVLDETSTNEDSNADGDLDILDHVTINGHGSTIDANSISRVIELYPVSFGDVIMTNLTITGGNDASGEGGGGIHAEGGSLTLEEVDFVGNVTTIDGGGMDFGSDGDLEITDSSFTGNAAGFYGGGLATDDSPGLRSITGTAFTQNTVADGSGGGAFLGLSGGSGWGLTRVSFAGNVATTSCPTPSEPDCGTGGGGIYLPAENGLITDSEFINNVTNGTGGAVYGQAIVSDTTFVGNTAGGSGGAVSASDLQVFDSEFSTNTGLFGGAVAVSDLGLISGSLFHNNTAAEDGGALYLERDMVVESSAIYNNVAAEDGGGIALGGGAVDITNTTISGNTGARGGGIARTLEGSGPFAIPQGGPAPTGPLSLFMATVADNAAASGSNVFRDPTQPNIEARGTIIADGVGGPNCNIALVSQGHNIEDADTCDLDNPSDLVNTDPLLQPLADNGGDTQTHALTAGSPAIDHVTIGCPAPIVDQRNESRPKGNACDAGAFESTLTGATPSPTPTAGPTDTPTPTPGVTATPTATPAATPSPTFPCDTLCSSPTPSGVERIWGDVDCDGEITTRDNQAELRFVLDQNPLSQDEPCPDIGDEVTGDGTARTWGDEDCDGEVTTRDNQSKLRFVLQQNPLSQTEPCPDVGESIEVTG